MFSPELGACFWCFLRAPSFALLPEETTELGGKIRGAELSFSFLSLEIICSSIRFLFIYELWSCNFPVRPMMLCRPWKAQRGSGSRHRYHPTLNVCVWCRCVLFGSYMCVAELLESGVYFAETGTGDIMV